MADSIRIRAKMEGDSADIKALMSHPMETGQRKDPKSGEKVPAHFIQTVTATLNDKAVLNADWGSGVSKNPFLGFKVKGAKAGDKVKVTWTDNKGETGSGEATVA